MLDFNVADNCVTTHFEGAVPVEKAPYTCHDQAIADMVPT